MAAPITAAAPRPSAYLPLRRFTVTEYEGLIAAGFFRDDERLELIEGEIVQMCPIGSHHAGCVNKLAAQLVRQTTEAVQINNQSPLRLNNGGEPQPDLLALRGRADYYAAANPTPADVLLLVEVSDSTLRYDRDVKLPLYAQAGICEVWIVNLVEEVIEVYNAPVAGSYTSRRVLRRGESLTPTILPDLVLAVTDILL